MKVLLLIFVAVTVSTAIHTLCMAIVGWILGAKVEIVSLFFGPKLLSAKIRGVDFRISLWPIGSYVKFHGDTSAHTPLDGNAFRDLHPLKRMLTAASGPLALLLCAANLVGLSRVPNSFTRGFGQFFTGAVMPFSEGQYLLHQLSEIATNGSITLLLGLIAVKMAAFNLLPFPTLNGGYITLEIVRLLIRIPDKVSERLSIVGFLVTVAVMCGWIVAIIYYLVH